MNTDKAYAQIRQLGKIFSDALMAAGYQVDGKSMLVHGLGAYGVLNLKGEDAELDAAYQIVMDDMIEAVRGQWVAA